MIKLILTCNNWYYRFHYMVISDNKKKMMPSASDREPPRAEKLAYKEAVLLVDPSVPELKGEVIIEYISTSNHVPQVKLISSYEHW